MTFLNADRNLPVKLPFSKIDATDPIGSGSWKHASTEIQTEKENILLRLSKPTPGLGWNKILKCKIYLSDS